VAALLSGGLDSSSVAWVAAQYLAQLGTPLHTFSHVPQYKEMLKKERPSLDRWFLDESDHILATAASGNMLPHLLDSAQLPIAAGIEQALDCFDELFHAAANAFWIIDLPRQASRLGFGALLTGENGNATISYRGLEYLLPWTHSFFLQNPHKLLKIAWLKPLFLRYFPLYFLKTRTSQAQYIRDSYVRPEVLDEWHIWEDIEAKKDSFIRYFAEAREEKLLILRPGSNPRCRFGAARSYLSGLEYRDPTADVSVIEYCLSIPNEAYFDSQGQPKQVLRQMMKNRLPAQVLHETRKGLQAADIRYRVLADQGRLGDILQGLLVHPNVRELLNVQKLRNDWTALVLEQRKDIYFVQNFIKGFMYAYFLSKNTW
jgi:asparagine synthase (glutamine-hydrolysing)